jgi:hypothetical protein
MKSPTKIVSSNEIYPILESWFLVVNGSGGYDTRPHMPDETGVDGFPKDYVLEGLPLPVKTIHRWSGTDKEERTEPYCDTSTVLYDYPVFVVPHYKGSSFVGETTYVRRDMERDIWYVYESATRS